MAIVKDIYEFLDEIAPFESALRFDNCGLLVGSRDKEVSRALLTLDITRQVVEEAQEIGAELIISHHPVIFKPLTNVDFNSPVHLLSKFDINAICAHTNLDIAQKGVNFHLAEKLALSKSEPLAYEENQPMGLIGELQENMEPARFALYVKDALECKGLRFTTPNKAIIRKVAVCSGSGGEFADEAARKGADAFVTGEIKHSQILKANEEDLMIVDAGHYKTENIIIQPLKIELEKHFKNVKFFVTEKFTDKIEYV